MRNLVSGASKMSRECFRSALSEFGVKVRFRDEEPEDWGYVNHHLDFQGVIESDANITYQKSYFSNYTHDDLSLVFYKKNGDPCGIAPLCVRESEHARFLASVNVSIEPIQFIAKLSNAECKRISKSFLRALVRYAALRDIREFKCHAYCEKMTNAINGWHSSCAELANSASVNYQAFVDLTHDLGVIRTDLRKSYKPLINKAEKIWSSKILRSGDIRDSDWKEFKFLHFVAAGNKQTRSDNSWDVQFSQILAENAFLVALYADDKRMVGGGFFTNTKDQGIYSVAAYDRSQFDKPLGHLVQWLAINELKRLGVKSYLIGDRPFPNDIPKPTEKEINIGIFKEGFCTGLRSRFVFSFLQPN